MHNVENKNVPCMRLGIFFTLISLSRFVFPIVDTIILSYYIPSSLNSMYFLDSSFSLLPHLLSTLQFLW